MKTQQHHPSKKKTQNKTPKQTKTNEKKPHQTKLKPNQPQQLENQKSPVALKRSWVSLGQHTCWISRCQGLNESSPVISSCPLSFGVFWWDCILPVAEQDHTKPPTSAKLPLLVFLDNWLAPVNIWALCQKSNCISCCYRKMYVGLFKLYIYIYIYMYMIDNI